MASEFKHLFSFRQGPATQAASISVYLTLWGGVPKILPIIMDFYDQAPYTYLGPYGVVYDEEQTDGSRVVVTSQAEHPFASITIQKHSQVPQGLYEFQTEFRLSSPDPGITLLNPEPLVIREPINWDSIRIKLVRDPDTHGFSYEFVDGEVQLEFDDEAGRSALKQAYGLRGNDAVVYLQFVLKKCEGDEIPYTAKLNYNIYRDYDGVIATSAERVSLAEQLRTRLDTKISMNATASLDGTDMGTAPRATIISLHSKGVIKKLDVGIEQSAWGPELFTADGQVFGTFGFDKYIYSELEQFNPHLPGFVESIEGIFPDYTAKEGGTHEVDVYLRYKMLLSGYSNGYPTGSHRHEVFFRINDEEPELLLDSANFQLFESPTRIVRTPPTTANPNGGGGATQKDPIAVNFKRTLELQAGDRLYFYIQQRHSHGLEYYYWLRMEPGAYFRITALTKRPASATKSIFVHEVLNRQLELITSRPQVLRSNLFGRTDLGYAVNGCGAMNTITNGYQVRQFETDQRPIQLSLATLYKSLDARYCLGMGLEWEGDQEVVRIDSRDHFYRDVEIVKLFGGTGYEEEFAKELAWNELEFGYNKFMDNEANTLDSFCTWHEYLTPVKSLKNRLIKRSDLITDAYAIEYTRRQQFNEAPTTSWKYDDDGFLIAVVWYPYITKYDSASTVPALRWLKPNILEIQGSWPELANARYVRVEQSTIAGGYNIQSVEVGDDLTRVYISAHAFSNEGTSNAAIMYPDGRGFYRPERLEKVAKRSNGSPWVSGLIDPKTTYNLRHSIKNMFDAWSPVLHGSLKYKQVTEWIRATFIKNNRDMEVQWVDSCMPGGLVREGADRQVFHLKSAAYSPEWIMKTVPLSWEMLNYIKQAHQGQNNEGKNNGYISVQNDCGEWVQGWLYDLSYNPSEEMADLKLLKKA